MDGKNIILIHGRNGYGKTSFINALKLLFLGSDSKEMRTLGSGRTLNSSQYLLGAGGDWNGIFNRKARAEKNGEYSVSVSWQEAQGQVTARRYWTVDATSSACVENLEILPAFFVGQEMLESLEQRQAFLADRLAPTLVPFFLYDAEQVQRIAESNSSAVQAQIERLLNITPVKTTEEYLEKVLTKLRRESKARELQLKLDGLKAQCDYEIAEQGQIELQIENLERDDAECKRKIDGLQKKLERAAKSEHDLGEAVLRSQIEQKKSELEQKSIEFLSSFPEIAPLVCQPKLVAKALQRLRQSSQGNAVALQNLQETVERIGRRLLLEEPLIKPALSEAQIQALQTKLGSLLKVEVAVAAEGNDGNEWAVGLERARTIESVLQQHGLNKNQRDLLLGLIKNVSTLAREELDLLSKLENIDSLPPGEREKVERMRIERDDLQQQTANMREKIGEAKSYLVSHQRRVQGFRKEIRGVEIEIHNATKNMTAVALAEKSLCAVRGYKAALKEKRREEIQTAMASHFKDDLMDSHGQVAGITFDDEFNMQYLDVDGEVVGMASISSGMKQLAAQALLWALKDAAGSSCPVVIDTPLARIDKGHQHRLLTRYYPQAAEQVIILPTDSELTPEKYTLLKPYIAAEFHLHNPSGEATEVTQAPLYADEVTT